MGHPSPSPTNDSDTTSFAGAQPEAPPRPSESASCENPSGGLLSTIEIGRRSLELATRVGQFLAPGKPAAEVQPISFRRLARLGAPWGASSMWRAARIYQFAQKYPELYGYTHLGVAHVAPTLCLKEPVRLAVLRRAERLRWTRRMVASRAKHLLGELARPVGGPPSGALEDCLRELTSAERQASLALSEANRESDAFNAAWSQLLPQSAAENTAISTK